MTSRNGSKGSKNQGSPEAGHNQMQLGSHLVTGDDNKGREYRSRKGSKSKEIHDQKG
ncbi:imidazoleglycerol-phosphate dehydratase [Ectobacillus funiculus]|uniref:Imidazoleglycerol-phosphate dehydratase n=1 Tax=Ectobacillus funiculus TaxID=137993 RepID=A0ABV5WCD9_9BACI